MANLKHLLTFLSVILLNFSCESSELKKIVRVGVVLDLNSPVGRIARRCMEMARSDFYAVNTNYKYKTRVTLLPKDSQNDVVVAVSAAIDMMKNTEVHAIIGPQKSEEAKFVIQLGEKAKVPIISFSATSPSLSPTKDKFFVRTSHDDSFQVRAITDIFRAYGWREVVLIYEDTDYGNGLIPYLTDAFQDINVRVLYRSVISANSNDGEILKELQAMKKNRTTIFLVHMIASLGSTIFRQAKKAGMMTEGYAWIVTEGLSTLLDPVDSKAMDSMQGVLGLRPYLQNSRRLEHFKTRWVSSDKSHNSTHGLNLFGLWAYDTFWAIAMAVEKAGTSNTSFLKPNISKSSSKVDIEALGTNEMGERLLNALVNTKFEGLSGNFKLVKGQLEPSAFEVFNVVGEKERIIGYWTQEKGLTVKYLNDSAKAVNSTSMNKLKPPLWPGETLEQPKKLRIGIPVREGFTEFIKVDWHPNKNKTKISGFAHEVFQEVLEVLEFPLPYEYIPFEKNRRSAGTYNELLYKIKEQEFDAVVGDTTIVANRSNYVDFTLPYSESGVSMVVLMKDDERKNFWIFLKPLSWNLWLTTGAAFIFTGLVIWVLEHRKNNEFRGPPDQQLGTLLWFSFSTLVFAHRERVENNLSRFVLIIWVFVVLILTQSYTASLTSMLTVQRWQPSFSDVEEIKRNGHMVGYQKDSFVKDLLTKQLNFDELKLKSYVTPEEYHKGLSNREVAAIFDEIPYIKVFLAKYCSGYMMVGPTYRTGGFGFAFTLGSPLVSYISRAILNVTEDKDKIQEIEKKTIGSIAICEGNDSKLSSGSLGLYSFGGLFIITGFASIFALLMYVCNFVRSHWPALNEFHPERSFLSKIAVLIKIFDKRDSSYPPRRHESRVHPAASPDRNDGMESHSRTLSAGEEEFFSDDGGDENHSPVHGVTSVDAPRTPSL